MDPSFPKTLTGVESLQALHNKLASLFYDTTQVVQEFVYKRKDLNHCLTYA